MSKSNSNTINGLTFSYEAVLPFIKQREIDNYQVRITALHERIHDSPGDDSRYLGWLHIFGETSSEVASVKEAAAKIRHDADVLVVIGIGGSYLGAQAALRMLRHTFSDMLTPGERNNPQVVFAGQHMSATYIHELLAVLRDKDVAVNVISKSGTTTEPAIAFRIFRAFLEKRYGKDGARERIYVTTDRYKGALRELTKQEGYTSFVIPDDVGGRYSVQTPVGLLPMAVGGISIDAVLTGAKDAAQDCQEADLDTNAAYQYAVIRHLLYEHGFTTEILANYEPKLQQFSAWWVQLFGESEGKDGKGIFPSVANFTTDLHALGQYIQDGRRDLFETVLRVKHVAERVQIPQEKHNLDGLNYLAGRSLHDINWISSKATIQAHVDGGVPNIVIDIPTLDAYTFGYMVHFFEKACAMSGYLLDVNPFDQPGVEAYKQNMFQLLGKPVINRRLFT